MVAGFFVAVLVVLVVAFFVLDLAVLAAGLVDLVAVFAVADLVVVLATLVALAALAVGLMPAALAILAAAALRREAVFFFMRSFLTALSYSD